MSNKKDDFENQLRNHVQLVNKDVFFSINIGKTYWQTLGSIWRVIMKEIEKGDKTSEF